MEGLPVNHPPQISLADVPKPTHFDQSRSGRHPGHHRLDRFPRGECLAAHECGAVSTPSWPGIRPTTASPSTSLSPVERRGKRGGEKRRDDNDEVPPVCVAFCQACSPRTIKQREMAQDTGEGMNELCTARVRSKVPPNTSPAQGGT